MEKLPDVIDLDDECSEDEELFEVHEEEEENSDDVLVLSDSADCNEDCSELLCDNLLKEDFDNFISDEVISDDYLDKDKDKSTLNCISSNATCRTRLEKSDNETSDFINLSDSHFNDADEDSNSLSKTKDIDVSNNFGADSNCTSKFTSMESHNSNSQLVSNSSFANFSSEVKSLVHESENKNCNIEIDNAIENAVIERDCNNVTEAMSLSNPTVVSETKSFNSYVSADTSSVTALPIDSLLDKNSSLVEKQSSNISLEIKRPSTIDFSHKAEAQESAKEVDCIASSSETVLENTTDPSTTLKNNVNESEAVLENNTNNSVAALKNSEETEGMLKNGMDDTKTILENCNEDVETLLENCTKDTEALLESKIEDVDFALVKKAEQSETIEAEHSSETILESKTKSEVLSNGLTKDSETKIKSSTSCLEIITERTADFHENIVERVTVEADIEKQNAGSQSKSKRKSNIFEGKESQSCNSVSGDNLYKQRKGELNTKETLKPLSNSKKHKKTKNRDEQSEIVEPKTRNMLNNVKSKYKITVIFVDKAKEVVEKIKEPFKTVVDEPPVNEGNQQSTINFDESIKLHLNSNSLDTEVKTALSAKELNLNSPTSKLNDSTKHGDKDSVKIGSSKDIVLSRSKDMSEMDKNLLNSLKSKRPKLETNDRSVKSSLMKEYIKKSTKVKNNLDNSISDKQIKEKRKITLLQNKEKFRIKNLPKSNINNTSLSSTVKKDKKSTPSYVNNEEEQCLSAHKENSETVNVHFEKETISQEKDKSCCNDSDYTTVKDGAKLPSLNNIRKDSQKLSLPETGDSNSGQGMKEKCVNITNKEICSDGIIPMEEGVIENLINSEKSIEISNIDEPNSCKDIKLISNKKSLKDLSQNNLRIKRRSMKLNAFMKQEMQEKCCGHWFPNTKRFIRHLIENAKNEIESFHAAKLINMDMQKCNICLIWLNNSNFRKHMKVQHSVTETLPSSSNSSKSTSDDQITESESIENATKLAQDSKVDDTGKENLQPKMQKPCPKSKKLKFNSNGLMERLKCHLGIEGSDVIMSSINDLPHFLKPALILRRCKIRLKRKFVPKKNIKPRYIDLLNEGTDNNSKPLKKKRIKPKQIDVSNNKENKNLELNESNISLKNEPSEVINDKISHKNLTKNENLRLNDQDINKVPKKFTKKLFSLQKKKTKVTVTKPSDFSEVKVLNHTINIETSISKNKESLKPPKHNHDNIKKNCVKFKNFKNYIDNPPIKKISLEKVRRRKRGRNLKRRRCGFHSSDSSESSSDDSDSSSSYSNFENEIYSNEEFTENEENIPTVELDLFTLSSINEDVSVLLVDPKNPNFKVLASMDAIFVGDSALSDVTNHMGYVSDDNAVVYISPNHFLFPDISDSEEVLPLKGKKAGNSLRRLGRPRKKNIIEVKTLINNNNNNNTNNNNNNNDKENTHSKMENKKFKEATDLVLSNKKLKLNVSKEVSPPVGDRLIDCNQELNKEEVSHIDDKDSINPKKENLIRKKKIGIALDVQKNSKIISNDCVPVTADKVNQLEEVVNEEKKISKVNSDDKVIVIKTSTRQDIKKDNLEKEHNMATVTISTNRKKTLVNGLPLDSVHLNAIQFEKQDSAQSILNSADINAVQLNEQNSLPKILDSAINKENLKNIPYKVLADSNNPILPTNFHISSLESSNNDNVNAQICDIEALNSLANQESKEKESLKCISPPLAEVNDRTSPCKTFVSTPPKKCLAPIKISTDTQVVVATAKIIPFEEEIEDGVCLEEMIEYDSDCVVIPSVDDRNTCQMSKNVHNTPEKSNEIESDSSSLMDCNSDISDILEDALLSSEIIIPEISKSSLFSELNFEEDLCNKEISKKLPHGININDLTPVKSDASIPKHLKKTISNSSINQTEIKDPDKKSNAIDINSDIEVTSDIEIDVSGNLHSMSPRKSPTYYKALVQGHNLWNTPLIFSPESFQPNKTKNITYDKFEKLNGGNCKQVNKIHNISPAKQSLPQISKKGITEPFSNELATISSKAKLKSSKSPKLMTPSKSPKMINTSKSPKMINIPKSLKMINTSKSPKMINTSKFSKVTKTLKSPKSLINSSKYSKFIAKTNKSPNLIKKSVLPNVIKRQSNYKSNKELGFKTPSKFPKSVTKTPEQIKSPKVLYNETYKSLKKQEPPSPLIVANVNSVVTPKKTLPKSESPKATKKSKLKVKNSLYNESVMHKGKSFDSEENESNSNTLISPVKQNVLQDLSKKSLKNRGKKSSTVVSQISPDSLKMRICVKDFGKIKEHHHKHKKKKKRSKKKRENLEDFQISSDMLSFADFKIKTEDVSESPVEPDVTSENFKTNSVNVEIQDDILIKKEIEEKSLTDHDTSGNTNESEQEVSVVFAKSLVVKHFDSPSLYHSRNLENCAEVNEKGSNSNMPDNILNSIRMENEETDKNACPENSSNVKFTDTSPNSNISPKSPFVDDRSWHSRGSKLKAQIMIADQQKGITNSFIGDNSKSPTTPTSNTPKPKLSRKSDPIKSKDIRNYFTPRKPKDEVNLLTSPLQSPLNEMCSPNVESKYIPIKTESLTSPDRWHITQSKTNPGSSIISKIPNKNKRKYSQRNMDNMDIRTFLSSSNAATKAVAGPSQPKKKRVDKSVSLPEKKLPKASTPKKICLDIKTEVEDCDFEGFEGTLNNCSGRRSQQLQEYVDVLRMNTWFDSNRFPVPIDQLCDWNENQLNIALFDIG